MNTRKTNIVATLGPASCDEATIEQMMLAGMDVARINFSHGGYEDYEKMITAVRGISAKLNIPLPIIQDLSGPKIRLGNFSDGTINLKNGSQFILTSEEYPGDENKVSITSSKLAGMVKQGTIIMLDDGKRKLEVVSADEKNIYCAVKEGGDISGHRGVNVIGADLDFGSITEKDMADIDFGIKHGIDFVALSFVRTAKDVDNLRGILKSKGSSSAIISKIETGEAVKNIDEIIAVSDCIMVARGDLAVELSPEEVPFIQKTIIKKAIDAGKPVITATHMLDSMVSSSVPTRAEVNDVANAILDGSDSVMLSAETAIGRYPALSIETMARIAKKTEDSPFFPEEVAKFKKVSHGVADSVSAAVVTIAANIGAKCIVAFSGHGFTPRMISRYRPTQPILVLTTEKTVQSELFLSYGCFPIVISESKSLDDTIELAKNKLKELGMLSPGESFVLSAGLPFGGDAGTNLLLVQNI